MHQWMSKYSELLRENSHFHKSTSFDKKNTDVSKFGCLSNYSNKLF